ncbi:ABC transporter permease [Streptomyces sp. VRA16 Mangrove soil]|uniref:ABC transporter permease n=1 Tax=Streptomyces sp. VRA16 Mangrove soil TaxID=2817434 RepID=UPI001A9EC071|nr:ABC transporter permease [Streptomyces sp. VRA16 Mangrove soil]MBO1337598.1 ABC transporter permease [Streptomyces sp. VRA16 Mangrove soil]
MSQVLDTPPPSTPPATATATTTGEDAAILAARYGLSVSGARPALGDYVRQLWARRHFITAFSTAKLTAQYSKSTLGQLWQVLTPLLNAVVYYLIFGVILGTSKGVPDFIPFLVTGVFVWTFTQSSVMSGVKAISGSMGLVRALHFPRASLPLSYCLQQLQQLLFSMIALIAILLAFGVPPSPSWILVLPALALQSVFNAGLALAMARLGARTPDLNQLMPFILRVWMYLSGVMFSLGDKLAKTDLPPVVQHAVQCNPAAVYIDLMRFALIDSFTRDQLPPHVWAWAVGWALLAGVGGFIYFWKAEETYGRD